MPCIFPDSPCLRDICISDGPAPPSRTYSIYIYSNDGNTLLYSTTFYSESDPQPPYSILYAYRADEQGVVGLYVGYSPWLLLFDLSEYSGLSYSPNQTVGEIALDTILAAKSSLPIPPNDVTVYVVDKVNYLITRYNGAKLITDAVSETPIDVSYNGSTIAELNIGDYKMFDILGSDNKPKILSTPIIIGNRMIPDVNESGIKQLFEYNFTLFIGDLQTGIPMPIGYDVEYTGDVVAPTWQNYDPALMTMSGDISAIERGTYTTVFTIIDPTLYEWEDGSTNPKSVTWKIGTSEWTRTTPTALSTACYYLAATTVGNYALFGGGCDSVRSYCSTVDAYDTSFTRTTPAALSTARSRLAATTVGNYALFGGGNSNDGYHSSVDAYDTSLTRTTPTALSTARSDFAATTVGNYALFSGGFGNGSYHSTVDAYDTSLTRTTPTALSTARYDFAATTVGNYALFGGGFGNGSYHSTVDAYDTSLTRTTPTALSTARKQLAATTIGNYALFGGGTSNDGYYSTVDAYDTSFTRTTPTALSTACYYLAATTVGNYALFSGGYGNDGYHSSVDAYDTSLTRTTPTALSTARKQLAATTIGNYALFGGGYVDGSYYSTVDAFSYTIT